MVWRMNVGGVVPARREGSTLALRSELLRLALVRQVDKVRDGREAPVVGLRRLWHGAA